MTEQTAADKESMRPLLTVMLVTYNQSAYIEETLQTILMQKTDFPFEILVADDCSTDDTREKIRRTVEGSGIPLRFAETEGNVGVLKNYRRGFSQVKTEYVAVMEGDDLWTNERRLQRHVDCLRAHQECVMSFNRFLAANYDDAAFSVTPALPQADGSDIHYVFSVDLARENLIGNFSTCVYRTRAVQSIEPSVYEQNAYDWLFHIMLLEKGPCAYLTEVMNIYRVHGGGTWSKMSEAEKMDAVLVSLREYDAYTGGRYHDAFCEHASRLQTVKLSALSREGSSAQGKRSFKSRLAWVARKVYDYMPPIFMILLKLMIPPRLISKVSYMLTKRNG